MSRFRTRKLYPNGFSFWQFFKHQAINTFHLIIVFGIISVFVFALFDRSAEAQEPLTFSFIAPYREIKLRLGTTWILPGGSEQQNTALRVYQDALRERGITDPEALLYGSALLVHENEKLTVDRVSFTGYDFGLCQMNTGKVPSRVFMKQHPEWLDLKKQAGWCADRFVKTYDKYNKSIFRAVVQNHCPACAAKGKDSTSIRVRGKDGKPHSVPLKPPYFERVKLTTKKLSPLL